MNWRIKVLLVAGIMGVAVLSGVVQGLTAPRGSGQRKGEGNRAGELTSDVQPYKITRNGEHEE